MKSWIALLLAVFTFIGLLTVSPAALARSPEMIQIEQIVDELEYRYEPNIRLIPQRSNSERIWLDDLRKLTNILDNGVAAPDRSLRSLQCDKLVCALRNP